MPEDDDLELDQLLARGRLSGRQYDAIERQVLAAVAPKTTRWPLAAMLSAAALACVLVVGLVLAGRAVSERSAGGVTVAARDGFTARGNGSAAPAAPVIDVGCAGRSAHVCRIGDTLLFSVSSTERGGYLCAFAERAGAPGRVWYFPGSDGKAPRVEALASTTILSQGVRLTTPHAVGSYRVTAWLSAEPAEESRALQQSRQIRGASIALEIIE